MVLFKRVKDVIICWDNKDIEDTNVKKIKNISVFIRWFLSYLIMLSLTLIVSIGLYFFAFDVIDEQGQKMNQTMLETVQVEIDGYFTEARSAVVSLMLDGDVRKAGNVKGSFSIRDRVMLYDIFQDINNQQIAFKKFSHIYVYFLNTNSVLSEQGHIDSKMFYDLYYQNPEMDYEEFVATMSSKWTGNIIKMPGMAGDHELVFLRNDFPRGNRGTNMTFAVTMSHKALAEWIGQLSWDENTEILIMDKNGVLFSSGELAGKILEQYGSNVEKLLQEESLHIGGKKHRFQMIESIEEGVYYVAVTPVAYVQQGAREIQMFMLIGLIVCITIGVALAYILTRRQYRPLRHVMNAFGEYKWEMGSEDEYEWLQEQTIHFLDEHKEIKKKFYDNEMVIRNQSIYRLVTLPYDETLMRESELEKDPDFIRPYNLVVLLHVMYDDDSQWKAEMDGGLLRFVIKNVMNELLEGRCGFEVIELADCFACVINGEESLLAGRDELENIMVQLQDFLGERMQLQVTAVFGSAQNGLEGIHPSYMAAREAKDYLEDQQLIWYDDVRNRHTLYQYPLEAEQRIINAIKIGQKDAACQWMDDVIDENYQGRELTAVMKGCLLSELLGTLVKGAEQGGSVECMKMLMEEKGIPEVANVGKIKEYFHEMVELLCEDIRRNAEMKRENGQFGKQVMKYVQQNFQDPDLNISITALHFDITPSYMSTLFKEQTGLSLLEYINNTRVERAKELLEEGKTLSEICTLTGFRSSGALIRVFKKTTGVTPGQMKKMNE